MSPMVPVNASNEDEKTEEYDDADDVQSSVSACANANNFLVQFPDYNALNDKYMALDVYFRGKEVATCLGEANDALKNLNNMKQINWVPWMCTKPTMRLTSEPAVVLPSDVMKTHAMQVTMMGNNTRMGRFFSNRIGDRTDRLYANRCFVHHYTGEGMEEGEFAEAREDLGFLQMDYNDVLNAD